MTIHTLASMFFGIAMILGFKQMGGGSRTGR